MVEVMPWKKINWENRDEGGKNGTSVQCTLYSLANNTLTVESEMDRTF